MKMDEHKSDAHGDGHCTVCAGIVAAARARGTGWDSATWEQSCSPSAGRIWEAAVEGRLQLVESPGGREPSARRDREV